MISDSCQVIGHKRLIIELKSFFQNTHLLGLPAGKIAGEDMFARLAHNKEVECEIVYAGDGERRQLPALDQMTEICFAVLIAKRTIDSLIEGRKIMFPFFIINIYYAF